SENDPRHVFEGNVDDTVERFWHGSSCVNMFTFVMIPGSETQLPMTQPLTINDAFTQASAWINASDLPIRSAFIGVSIAYADPASTYDPTSDVDCYLVVEGDPPEGKIGKITVNGVLLDVSWLPWEQLQSAESHAVLASL